jgi:hypothetical protein
MLIAVATGASRHLATEVMTNRTRWRSGGVRVLPNELIRWKPVVSGDPAGFDCPPVVAAVAGVQLSIGPRSTPDLIL